MSVRVFGKSSIIFNLSNNGTIDPPYVDSIWIVNTDQEPLRKLYAQSRDTIDISFLEERGTYILRVYIDGCIKSRTFVYRNVQNKWSDTWSDTWNVLSHGWDPEGGDDPYMPYTFIYQLEEDTTINDLTYQRLTGRFSLSTMPSNKEYVAALRFAENKKVFVHYDNTEYLLYDFGAQVGDTLEIFGGIDYYKDFKTLPHVITEIDTLDDGKLQMQLMVNLQDEWHERSIPITWIEGVGSKDGVVQNVATLKIGLVGIELLCAYHNDECIYTTDNPYYTSLGCVYNDPIFSATEEVNAPTQSVQKIMYNGQLLILRDSKTYNVMGVEVGE